MKKIIILIMTAFMFAPVIQAQISSDLESHILQGKCNLIIAVNAWNEYQLQGARAFFERLLEDDSVSWLIHYYVAYADMRIVNYYMSLQNTEKAKEILDDAIQHLEKSLEIKEDSAESYALLGSLIGTKIGLNPLLGITLGAKSGMFIRKAFELDPDNPRVSFIAGQSAYYTPRMWGGGKDKALAHLDKAIEYFETDIDEESIYPNWGLEDTYIYLGLTQMDLGELNAAKESFNYVLKMNPNNGWVKYTLMSNLEEKMAGEGNE